MGRRHQDREIIINMVSAMLQVGSKVSKDRGGGKKFILPESIQKGFPEKVIFVLLLKR